MACSGDYNALSRMKS